MQRIALHKITKGLTGNYKISFLKYADKINDGHYASLD